MHLRREKKSWFWLGLSFALGCGGSERSPASEPGSRAADAATSGKEGSSGRESSVASPGKPAAANSSMAPIAATSAGRGGDAAGIGGTEGPLAAGAGGSAAGSAGEKQGGAGAMSARSAGSGDYSFLTCPNAEPLDPATGDWDGYPACDGMVQCRGEARCFPTELVEARFSSPMLERMPDCSAGKCVPDEFVHTGKVQFKSCTGDAGEGRCIPQCFALWVMPLSSIFERGAYGCGREEVCAPCVNPLDQMPTGACPTTTCGGA